MSFKFKIKLTKRDLPGLGGTVVKVKVGQGLYQKLQKGNIVNYGTKGDFDLSLMKDTLSDLFYNKKDIKNEYRKTFSFRSQILKQTYKFG